MGNAPSSATNPMDLSSSGIARSDPAMGSVEADLRKLGVSKSKSPEQRDAMTKEDHQRRRKASPPSSSKKLGSLEGSLVAAEDYISKVDPARAGLDESQLGEAFAATSRKTSRGKNKKSRDRDHSDSSTLMDGSSQEMNSSSCRHRERSSRDRTTKTKAKKPAKDIQDHMKEIEEFVIAVNKSKDAKGQLKELAASATGKR